MGVESAAQRGSHRASRRGAELEFQQATQSRTASLSRSQTVYSTFYLEPGTICLSGFVYVQL